MGVNGVACFVLALSPASVLMIERRSMFASNLLPPTTQAHLAPAYKVCCISQQLTLI